MACETCYNFSSSSYYTTSSSSLLIVSKLQPGVLFLHYCPPPNKPGVAVNTSFKSSRFRTTQAETVEPWGAVPVRAQQALQEVIKGLLGSRTHLQTLHLTGNSQDSPTESAWNGVWVSQRSTVMCVCVWWEAEMKGVAPGVRSEINWCWRLIGAKGVTQECVCVCVSLSIYRPHSLVSKSLLWPSLTLTWCDLFKWPRRNQTIHSTSLLSTYRDMFLPAEYW